MSLGEATKRMGDGAASFVGSQQQYAEEEPSIQRPTIVTACPLGMYKLKGIAVRVWAGIAGRLSFAVGVHRRCCEFEHCRECVQKGDMENSSIEVCAGIADCSRPV
eukprot:1151288-Pelagomonas_calceolata.AAC.1